VTHESVSRGQTSALSSHSEQRRVSVCVHVPQSNTLLPRPSTDAAAADADLMSEIHNCRNELSQLLTAVSQLEVRFRDVPDSNF